jgi:hypothetical protein
MVHGDFKVGEICQAGGRFVCLACRRAGKSVVITVETGGTFPLCASCAERGAPEIDTVWKREGAARAGAKAD